MNSNEMSEAVHVGDGHNSKTAGADLPLGNFYAAIDYGYR
jgi:hypothetical protein